MFGFVSLPASTAKVQTRSSPALSFKAALSVTATKPTVSRTNSIIKMTAANMAPSVTTINNPLYTKPQNPEFEKFGAPPPFSLEDVRKSIPAECWVKDTTKSMLYAFRDVAVVFALAKAALVLNNPIAWILYTLIQGTMFWALFVVGHDAGHGSFSNSKFLNSLIGHLTHASILVPFHGWRISHRDHHANHGHVGNDESWYAYSQQDYESMSVSRRMMRFELPFALFGYPVYLFKRTPGKQGSHWLPSSPLFKKNEAGQVLTSTSACIAMLGVLAAVASKIGVALLAKLYLGPLVMFWVWLSIVTYLHHTDESCPVYRDGEWTYLRGALSTTDRDYGLMLNHVTHDIGTHVVHHMFPQIPHYNLIKATDAIKPVVGDYYREPEASGFLPFHLIRNLTDSFKKCRFVDNEGTVLFYRN